MRTLPNDLPRTVLAVLFLGLLIAGAFWVVRPFLAALLWGAMIVIATWPVRLALERWLGGRRRLAVSALTVALLLLFVLPLFFAVGALVSNADEIGGQAKKLAEAGLPRAPAWLASVPVVGERAVAAWDRIAGSQLGELFHRVTPYLGDVASWFAGQVGGLGKLLVQFLLTVVIAAVLWSSGQAWAAWVVRFARRLAGDEGERVVILAGQAVRAVALGVVVTALVQSALAGIGLAIAGIPFASVLTVVMFLLAIAQLGPLPVLVPAVIWLFFQGSTGWGIFLLVWSLVVGTMDNFLRPMLIRRGADLPLLLVFVGVLGGLMSFGLVGLFIGPVVLAVAHTLLGAWIAEGPKEPAAAGAGTPAAATTPGPAV